MVIGHRFSGCRARNCLPWLLVTGFLDVGLEIEHQSDHIRSYHQMLNTQPFNKYSPSSPQMLMKTVFQKQQIS